MGDFFFTKDGLEEALNMAREGSTNAEILRHAAPVRRNENDYDHPDNYPYTDIGSDLKDFAMEVRKGTPLDEIARETKLGRCVFLHTMKRKLWLDFSYRSELNYGGNHGTMSRDEAMKYVATYGHINAVAEQYEEDMLNAEVKGDLLDWVKFLHVPMFLAVYIHMHTRDVDKSLQEERKVVIKQVYAYGMTAEQLYHFTPETGMQVGLDKIINNAKSFWGHWPDP